MKVRLIVTAAIFLTTFSSVQAQGDVSRGEAAFRQCAACHLLDPGYHLTGPSLFGEVVVAADALPLEDMRKMIEPLLESAPQE